ncbi:MAG TPA: hypothetical protein VMA09_13540 [Candidatus Binataceae bacterium]|nr:hypothetical protein [Candidatus Binataceae bacterium]
MIRRICLLSVAIALLGVAMIGTAHAAGAPELDPGSAASGLVLLVGGALLLIERHRGK